MNAEELLSIDPKDMHVIREYCLIRMEQTGEDWESVINNMHAGIRRRSILIIDNLGVSAVLLNNKVKVYAVGTITIPVFAKAVAEVIIEDKLIK